MTRDIDRDYLVRDLRRTMVRLAANERWYEQSWLGVPIWQLPEDMIRLQRIVAEIRPQWIIETGTKFGGSAIFFSSLLSLCGSADGGVISIDITVPAVVRKTVAEHPQGALVKAILEQDAAAADTAAEVARLIGPASGPVMIFLDDNHNADHVHAELRHYAPLVSLGSYLIVADTVFADLGGTPVGAPTEKYPDVERSNPRAALARFLEETADFVVDRRFSEGGPGNFPDGFLKRVR